MTQPSAGNGFASIREEERAGGRRVGGLYEGGGVFGLLHSSGNGYFLTAVYSSIKGFALRAL